MKMNYEAPAAEVISFAAKEQLAKLDIRLDNMRGDIGLEIADI